jgi:hypothetical protein
MAYKLTSMSITYDLDAKRLGQPTFDLTHYEANGRVGSIYSFFNFRWALETAEVLWVRCDLIPINIRIPNKQGEIDMANWKVYKPDMVAYILGTGPEPTIDEHGDEYPIWFLTRCDADENDIIYSTYFSYEDLEKAAIELADKLNVPFENEASQA